MEHRATVTPQTDNKVRVECTCGWKTREYNTALSALTVHRTHATAMGKP